MAVRISAYGLAWHIQRGVGAVRLVGQDGKNWTSGALDAATLGAIASVLREGASAQGGLLFGGSEHAELHSAVDATLKPLSGESPFPW